jgi:hypothetical protein
VHHAINPEYIDKNHSQIFIIWDKFSILWKEPPPPVMALQDQLKPGTIRINFQHLGLLISDAWRAETGDTIWFKPTGWRPENFEEKYPVNKITNVYALINME